MTLVATRNTVGGGNNGINLIIIIIITIYYFLLFIIIIIIITIARDNRTSVGGGPLAVRTSAVSLSLFSVAHDAGREIVRRDRALRPVGRRRRVSSV